jgi:RHS repeat-associated protein
LELGYGQQWNRAVGLGYGDPRVCRELRDDSAGRKVGETITAAGSSYSLNYGYDATLGTLQTITYPTSTYPSTGSARFEVLYEYQNGYLKNVKDYNSQSTVFWQAIAQDARGHVIQEQLGNGQQSYLDFDETNGRLNAIQTGSGGGSATQNLNYNWDKVGNLLSRQDANQGLTESFTYDSLYRLQTASLNGTQTLSVGYDAIGNISTKSDVANASGGTNHTYDYSSAQSTCSYTGLTSQPHAVRNAGGTVYCYDANGNMVSRNGATVSWYPFDMPQTINQAGGNYSTFYYAPDRSRYRQTSLNASVTEDRIYVAGLFEKLNSSSSGLEYRNYIVANGEKVAIKVLSASRNDTLYLHSDHLGSTDVITDQSAQIKLRASYDAWGNRRGSAWSGTPSASDSSAINSTTHLGFTAQEQLDNLSLVDLNGRVYDPVIARFMSADPYVQAPYRSQSLNRYSYTWNNPLNQTDPSGFCAGSNIVGAGNDSAACGFSSEAQTSSQAAAQVTAEINAYVQSAYQTLGSLVGPTSGDATVLTGQVDQNSMAREQQTADTSVSPQMAEVTVTASTDGQTEHKRGMLD